MFKIKEEHKEEYKKHHQNVWPEMLDLITKRGVKNYSIFMTPEGLLFGYYEIPDNFKKESLSAKDEEINTKWQNFMAPYFENIGGKHSEKRSIILEEVFHID
tara:strand:- start:4268 stop:4573 length:306 start_codon:yes stop_codon:yes gene_type:complete